MFLLITFNNIMYDIDYDRNKPKIGLFFTNI